MEVMRQEIEKFIIFSRYSESTKLNYRLYLNKFSEYLAEKTSSSLEELHLEKIFEIYDRDGNFVAYLPINSKLIDDYLFNNLSNGYHSLLYMRKALSAFFSFLFRNYNFHNVMEDISFRLNKYKSNSPVKKSLSKHEVLKFFHYLVSYSNKLDRDVLLFTLFITTGCRKSEILNIKVRDIFWEDNTILLPKTKHNHSRMVPLRKGMSGYIKVYCDHYNLKEGDSLFDLSPSQVNNIFNKFLEMANLPRLKIHALRHTFATLMAESGVEVTVVQQLLGHSDLFTTKNYIHPNIIRNNNITIKENSAIYSKLFQQQKIKSNKKVNP